MTDSYFETLGMGVAKALAKARDIADQTLVDHLTPLPGAMDNALARRSMKSGPRYGGDRGTFDMPTNGMGWRANARDQDPDPDQEPGQGLISPDDLLQMIQLCLQKLTGADRQEFAEGLARLIDTETGAEDRVVASNRQALDRSRRNGANRPAQDAAIQNLNHSNFQRRWGNLTKNISYHGCGPADPR
jgi:hypothetical protein